MADKEIDANMAAATMLPAALDSSLLEYAPSVGTGSLMISSSHSLSRLYESTVTQQQLNDQMSAASTSKAITNIFDVNNEKMAILEQFAAFVRNV